MRWAIILIIAIALSGFAVYSNLERPTMQPAVASSTTPQGVGELTERYTDPKLNFELETPARTITKLQGFEGFLPLTQSPVVAFVLPEDSFKGTNLVEAGVYIGASSAKSAVSGCMQAVSGEATSSVATFNETTWNAYTSTGAAAGNTYQEKAYRTVHGKYCFEIVELLHSGNIDNYPAGSVVRFDKDTFSNTLESIAQTFSFTK